MAFFILFLKHTPKKNDIFILHIYFHIFQFKKCSFKIREKNKKTETFKRLFKLYILELLYILDR